MSVLEDLTEISRIRIALVLGVGGGGDAVGSLHTYRLLRSCEARPILGVLPWERFVIDPHPDPVGIDEIREAERASSSIALVSGRSYVVRPLVTYRPQISRVLEVINDVGFVYDASRPIDEIADDLKSLCEAEGVDVVFGIDVGGDVIARGFERELMSPLGDTYSLAVLWRLSERSGIPVVVGILGPGADGELSKDYVLARLSECARAGEYLGSIGLTRADVKLFESVLPHVETEASRIPVEAFRGLVGTKVLRGGIRRAQVDISVAATHYITLRGALMLNELVKIVRGSSSIHDARRRLNEIGVMTELDVKEELYREVLMIGSPRSVNVEKVVRRVLSRFGKL